MAESYPVGPEELPNQSERLTALAESTFTRIGSWGPGGLSHLGIDYQESTDPETGVVTRIAQYSGDKDTNPLKAALGDEKGPDVTLTSAGHPDRSSAEVRYSAWIGNDMKIEWDANTPPLISHADGGGVGMEAEQFADVQADLISSLYILDKRMADELTTMTPPEVFTTPGRMRRIMRRILSSLVNKDSRDGTIHYPDMQIDERNQQDGPPEHPFR